MATRKWRGTLELAEMPDSPEWDFSGEAIVCTRKFEGDHAKCLSDKPARGTIQEGFDGYPVDRTNVKKLPGGKGLLTVSARGAPAEPAEQDTAETKYELDWTESQRPLITNPCFLADGALEIDANGMPAVRLWEDCPDADIKAAKRYYEDNQKRTPAGGIALVDVSDGADAYAQKILNGTDSWVLYSPVARKTSTSVKKLEEEASAGRIQTPEGFGASLPSGFQWLKTSDRYSRTGKHGKWERTEEWTGALTIDTDLYDEVV